MAVLGVTVSVDMTPAIGIVKSARQRQIALKAVQAGARIVAKAAKAIVPRRKNSPGRDAKSGRFVSSGSAGGSASRSGALKQSLGVKAEKGKRGQTLALAVVGARKKFQKMVVPPRGKKPRRVVPAFYAHLVELGTKPHGIGKGRHPGTKPQPFLAPAYRNNRDRIAAEMARVMAAEVFKALAKVKYQQRRKG